MEEDKNIRLTVVHPSEEEDDLTIDLSSAFDFLKRFFILWLAAAVAVGAFFGGFGILLRDFLPSSEAAAVIRFTFDDNNRTLDPQALDIQKITSTGVVAEALDSLGISMEKSDDVRTELHVEGIIPDSVIDRRTLFYRLFSDSGDADVALELLNTNYTSSQYVLYFNYQNAGFSREEGVNILNAVLDAYRSYFMETYTKRPLLGSMGSVIDYKDYDYAEAVSIFTDSLNTTLSFLRQYRGGTFRSSTTGYSVDDLIRQAESIQEIDLARVSAFVTKNSVSRNSPRDVVSRYEWLMNENRERRSVEESKLAALSTAVENYRKDPQLYMFGESGAIQGPGGEMNGVYDELVTQMLQTESVISGITRTNRYYQSVVEQFQESEEQLQSNDIDRVEKDFASLNEKINNLADTVNKTMEDYFDATLSSLFLVQMPAVAEATPTFSLTFIKIVAAAEAVPFVIYLCAAFWTMFSAAFREAKEKKREGAAV